MIMEIFHSFWELSSVVLLAKVKLNINLISDSSHWCHLLVPQSYPIPTFITSLYLLESFVNLIKTLRIFLLYFILPYKDETSLDKGYFFFFLSTVPSNYSSYLLSYCSLSLLLTSTCLPTFQKTFECNNRDSQYYKIQENETTLYGLDIPMNSG